MIYTEEQIFKCLACCEAIIDRNLYLAKKWRNSYIYADTPTAVPAGEVYQHKANEWMKYRKEIRSLLSRRYSTKEIIRRSKACQKKTTQKAVIDLIAQIHKGDVQLEE